MSAGYIPAGGLWTAAERTAYRKAEPGAETELHRAIGTVEALEAALRDAQNETRLLLDEQNAVIVDSDRAGKMIERDALLAALGGKS